MKRLIFCLFYIAAIGSLSSAQTKSDEIMSRTEQHVAKFLDQFSEVKCTELVEQSKLGKNGKPEYQERSKFDYLLIAQNNGGELSLDESRLEEQSAQHKKNVSLLVTNGFATLLLVFHPYYESGFEFSPAEFDIWNGRQIAKIRFRHVRGMRTMTALMLRGREYPLEMMGTAWIDQESGAILRIDAELQSNMEDIGLRTLRSQVTYTPVQFRGLKEAQWLPSEATIEVETPRQHWRNVHHFTTYQRFDVDTQYRDKVPDSLKVPR